MTTVADVAAALDAIAPPALAEDWDNVGLLVGDRRSRCRKLLLCIDLTPAVIDEARRAKADMVMAYHPVIFREVKRVTPEAGVVYDAVRANLAVYSMHTAYDHAVGGANDCLADALGMGSVRRPIRPHAGADQCKIVVFVPHSDWVAVAEAAFAAGAGRIGRYDRCSFFAEGIGTFEGAAGTTPAIGQAGRWERTPEVRWEVVCPNARAAGVIAAIRAAHSYEEPAIDVIALAASDPRLGLGRIGPLDVPASLSAVLDRVRKVCRVEHLQLIGPARGNVRTLAVGCGSCGPLWREAASAGADLYVTGELRHHDAREADQTDTTIACVCHSNSERPTLKPLAARLRKALPNLSVALSRADRDPIRIV